jgi:hypothetical protein
MIGNPRPNVAVPTHYFKVFLASKQVCPYFLTPDFLY